MLQEEEKTEEVVVRREDHAGKRDSDVWICADDVVVHLETIR